MRVGVPDKVGAGTTTRVTFTMKVPDPILKVTVPVYVPAGSCALRFEAEIVTLVEAPAFKVLAVGLTKSHFVPLLVNALADQTPTGPQLVIATVCAAGSLTLATPLYLSAFDVPLTQPGCIVKDTGKDSVTLFCWPLKVSVTA